MKKKRGRPRGCVDKKKRITDIISLIQQGEVYAVIGKKYGITRQRVSQIATSCDIYQPGKGAPVKYDRKLFLYLYEQGLSDVAIAKECGAASHSVVSKWRKKSGLPPNKPPLCHNTIQSYLLRLEGLSFQKIGQRLGLSTMTVYYGYKAYKKRLDSLKPSPLQGSVDSSGPER